MARRYANVAVLLVFAALLTSCVHPSETGERKYEVPIDIKVHETANHNTIRVIINVNAKASRDVEAEQQVKPDVDVSVVP